jgi:hypothetical protein
MDIQQTVFRFESKSCKRLVRIFHGPGNGIPLGIERTIVARTKESVVNAFPMHSAPEMRADAGKRHEILLRSRVADPGDHDFLASRRRERPGTAGRKSCKVRHKLPRRLFTTRRVHEPCGKGRQHPISGDQPAYHETGRAPRKKRSPVRCRIVVFCCHESPRCAHIRTKHCDTRETARGTSRHSTQTVQCFSEEFGNLPHQPCIAKVRPNRILNPAQRQLKPLATRHRIGSQR